MRFVRKWSYASANHLAGAMKENHQKRAVYYFGFQLLYGESVKLIILVAVSFLLGILAPTMIIFLTFATLRMAAGGYHMDTYGKCLYVSMMLFITAGLAAHYTLNYWNMIYLLLLIAITFILGLYLVVKYAPRDTPNKPITQPEEIRKFKRLSMVYLAVWLPVAVLLTLFKFNMAVLALSFGVLLEIFTLTPLGHRFFDFIKNKSIETNITKYIEKNT